MDVSVITLQSQAPSFFFLFSLCNLQVFFLFITGLGEIHFSQSFLKEMNLISLTQSRKLDVYISG